MPNALDITGQRFGRLVALKKAPSRADVFAMLQEKLKKNIV